MTDLEKWLKKMWDKHSEHGFFSYAEQQQVLRVLEVAVAEFENMKDTWDIYFTNWGRERAEKTLTQMNQIVKEK